MVPTLSSPPPRPLFPRRGRPYTGRILKHTTRNDVETELGIMAVKKKGESFTEFNAKALLREVQHRLLLQEDPDLAHQFDVRLGLAEEQTLPPSVQASPLALADPQKKSESAPDAPQGLPVSDLWERMRPPLLDIVGEAQYQMMLAPCRMLSDEQGLLTLGVPNPYFQEQLAERFAGAINAALGALGEEERALSFEVLARPKDPEPTPERAPAEEPSRPISVSEECARRIAALEAREGRPLSYARQTQIQEEVKAELAPNTPVKMTGQELLQVVEKVAQAAVQKEVEKQKKKLPKKASPFDPDPDGKKRPRLSALSWEASVILQALIERARLAERSAAWVAESFRQSTGNPLHPDDYEIVKHQLEENPERPRDG